MRIKTNVFISLVLAVCLMGTVGCVKKKTEQSMPNTSYPNINVGNGLGNNTENKWLTAKTDEEIFSLMKKASENTAAYSGAFTVTMDYTSTDKEGETEVYSNADTQWATVDPSRYLYASDAEYDSDEEYKIFEKEGYYYLHIGGYMNGCRGISREEVEEWIHEVSPAGMLMDLSYVFEAVDFAELKGAWEEVFASDLEKERADTYADAMAAVTFSTQNNNGDLSLTIAWDTTTLSSGYDYYEGVIANHISYTYYAKNNMLYAIDITEITESEEEQTKHYSAFNRKCAYTFAFDEEFYASIQEIEPTEEDRLNPNTRSITKKLVFDGGSYTVQMEGATVAEMLESLEEGKDRWGIQAEWDIDGVYLDETCETLVPNDMDFEEFLALPTIYSGKITAKDGWGRHYKREIYTYDYLRSYALVYGSSGESESMSSSWVDGNFITVEEQEIILTMPQRRVFDWVL